MARQTIGEDIAVIKNQMINLSADFKDFKDDYKSYCKKVDDVDDRQIAIEVKTSNLAIFQIAFSTIVSAIAAYLGVKK